MEWILLVLAAQASQLVVVPEASPPAQSAPPPAAHGPQVYAVIFEVVTDADGKVLNVTVSRVVDPASGSTLPVPVKVSPAYVAAARARIEARAQEKRSRTYYTYFLLDPRAPKVVQTSPH